MKMRIVPETATFAMQCGAVDRVHWNDGWSPQKIFERGWPGVLAASPHSGRVSREAVERVAEAIFESDRAEAVARVRGKIRLTQWRRMQCVPNVDGYLPWDLARWGNGCGTYIGWDNCNAYRRRARAAIAALGLEVAPDAATARGGDGEEAGE